MLTIIEKKSKWTPKHKRKKKMHDTTFYDDLGPKKYLGPRDPTIGSIP